MSRKQAWRHNWREAGRGLTVRNEAGQSSLYIYDQIGVDMWGDGISAEAFVSELKSINAAEIHLHVNSPGGDCYEARAMHAAINEHPARIVAHIEGLAASAAGFLIMGADEIQMVEGSLFMMHNAWTVVYGNTHDLKHNAAKLDKIDAAIAADYSGRTGTPVSEILEMMAAETWFSAQEAQEAGLVDSVILSTKAKASASAFNYDLSVYKNAPRPPESPATKKPNQNEVARAHLERGARLLRI